jgi:two-component system response regulator FixJ
VRSDGPPLRGGCGAMTGRDDVLPELEEGVGEGPAYVVAQDPALRDAMAAALQAEGFAVLAFDSVAELTARVAELAPGCIVSGLCVHATDATLLTDELAARYCPLPVVELAPAGDVDTAVRAMKAGAADVVALPLRAGALAAAVRAALEGGVQPRMPSGIPEALRLRLSRLTRRERQVLDAIVRGDGNKAIGQELGISPRTVEVHRAKVMEKLSCRSVADVIRLAVQAGLFRP